MRPPPPQKKRKGSSFVKLIFEAPPDSRWDRVCAEKYVEIKLSLAYIILSLKGIVWLLFQEHRVQDWPFIYFCPASRRNCGGNKKENDLVFHQHKEKEFFSFLFCCSCIDRQWRRILAEREKTSSRFLCSLAFIRRHRRCLRCWEKSTLFPPSPVCLRLGSRPFCFYSIAIFLTLILGFPPLQNGEKRERKKLDVQVEGYDAVR